MPDTRQQQRCNKLFVQSCRDALQKAGYRIAEYPGPIVRVRIEGREPGQSYLLGHPGGLVETYLRLCQWAGVFVPLEGGV